MSREDAFKVEGTIVEVLSNKTYRVELANGHRFLGYVSGKGWAARPPMIPGQKVRVQMSPYDLSEARILLEN